MAEFANLILETIEPGIARLTVNRPEKRNSLNDETIEELDQAFAAIETDDSLRVLIVTGAGDKAFIAGADIGELVDRDPILGRKVTKRRQQVYTRLEELPIPSIAAINGWAMGTGLEVAMACTMRVAAKSARMGQPEVKLGITPGAGGTQRLPRLVGMGLAMEIILTGDPIPADRALAIGLVNRMADTDMLAEEALELARKLAARPKLALQYAKEAVLRYAEGSLAEGLAHESYLHALSCGTEDKKEGVAAFLEKRDPVFSGR
ncbi:MAG: enoyl-CoA hydratase/isomerase family protein [Deltaproteobacteria bacterium]|nr:enoyl-CoA hydratase/isomerase family protein [Deltaproteobacteria bacterium]